MHCEIRVVTVAGVTGASERTMTMTRTGQILMTLLTTACLATPGRGRREAAAPSGRAASGQFANQQLAAPLRLYGVWRVPRPSDRELVV